ncbi:uncharacterized protein LOC133920591 [Phragmites australis]|uniref:uncharacterized protein LOC133920591 n=1 Tax=Phragmites australis TaxID=29695 RepID=UPI002D76EEED|nr:uncharacterized protein LOC133920591 [Phragmites australis]
MSTSEVLGNDDLLGEILIRLVSPTSLVRAALVSKRWLRGTSGQTFLRCFRALHPPRLLGFYISGDGFPRPEFVPTPTPQPSEAAAVHRANFGFDAFAEFSSSVWDCRNGRVLFEFAECFILVRCPAVRAPLRYPDQDMSLLPPQPSTWPESPHAMLLPDDGGDDASCYRVDIHQWGQTSCAQVSVLRSGAWTVHCSAWAKLASTLDRPMITLLAGGKLYMVTVAGYILGLDLASASLFTVELPEGVAYDYYGNLVPCRGDDSVLYLFHVKGDQLSVWLCRMDDRGGAGTGGWVLRETISVSKICGDLLKQGSEPADGDTSTDVVGVGDNAEFVFLELSPHGVVVYLHLGTRKVEKVHQRDPDNDHIIRVHPFFMVWPPVFPALDAQEGEAVHQE